VLLSRDLQRFYAEVLRRFAYLEVILPVNGLTVEGSTCIL